MNSGRLNGHDVLVVPVVRHVPVGCRVMVRVGMVWRDGEMLPIRTAPLLGRYAAGHVSKMPLRRWRWKVGRSWVIPSRRPMRVAMVEGVMVLPFPRQGVRFRFHADDLSVTIAVKWYRRRIGRKRRQRTIWTFAFTQSTKKTFIKKFIIKIIE